MSEPTQALSRCANSQDDGPRCEAPDRASAPGVSGAFANRETTNGLLLDGLRLLLVDDSRDNRLLFTRILTGAGASVEIACNGGEAIAVQRTGEFHAIIMDIQMPEVDGYMATREIRRGGFTGPIIALTAHDVDGEESRCLAAGCSHYRGKPIDRSSLLRAVLEALGAK